MFARRRLGASLGEPIQGVRYCTCYLCRYIEAFDRNLPAPDTRLAGRIGGRPTRNDSRSPSAHYSLDLPNQQLLSSTNTHPKNTTLCLFAPLRRVDKSRAARVMAVGGAARVMAVGGCPGSTPNPVHKIHFHTYTHCLCVGYRDLLPVFSCFYRCYQK